MNKVDFTSKVNEHIEKYKLHELVSEEEFQFVLSLYRLDNLYKAYQLNNKTVPLGSFIICLTFVEGAEYLKLTKREIRETLFALFVYNFKLTAKEVNELMKQFDNKKNPQTFSEEEITSVDRLVRYIKKGSAKTAPDDRKKVLIDTLNCIPLLVISDTVNRLSVYDKGDIRIFINKLQSQQYKTRWMNTKAFHLNFPDRIKTLMKDTKCQSMSSY
jgi:hypothetical protein